MNAFGSPKAKSWAKILDCREQRVSQPFALEPGDRVPGFTVLAADPPTELVLGGNHRYARYGLTFRIAGQPGFEAVSAETRAEFPGIRGAVYKALVVGTGAHARVVRRLLARAKRRAEEIERAA